MAIIFRTTDNAKWGAGQGSDLSAGQIDNNFWELFSAVSALQDHAETNSQIAFFAVAGDQFFVHMTDHSVLGPYQLPTSQWNFRGAWEADTIYAPMDVVTNGGAVYLVILDHTSAGTFDPGATDGLGHDLYGQILGAPDDTMPAGGVIAQRLVKLSSTDFDADWAYEPRNVAVYIEGIPTSGETLMRYTMTDTLTFPAGLSASRASCGTAPLVANSYNLFKNGSSIGFVSFAIGATVGTFVFSADVTFSPGDVLVITAPASPDHVQANTSITLVGNITG